MDLQNQDLDIPTNEPLFRVISFHELISTLERKLLRFARVDTMIDRNEAVTSVLASETAHAFVGTDVDPLDVAKRHDLTKKSYFINCWTRDAENIAIWSIYSSNKDRVMIRTSSGKLKAALGDLDDNTLALDNGLFLKSKTVSNVRYVNLKDLADQWRRKAEAMRDAKRRDLEAGITDGTGPLTAKQLRSLTAGDLKTLYLSKDERYEYEQEVRAVLEFKVRLDETKEPIDPEVSFWKSSGERTLQDSDEPPKQVFIPIGDDFIEEILVDGRMSDWEREAVDHVLQKYGMTAEVSSAFSSLYK